MSSQSLLGIGIYGIPEASRLLRMSRSRIRRLMLGYTWRLKSGEPTSSPPVIHGQLPKYESHVELGFLDLVEALAIKGMLEGSPPIPWRDVRLAHDAAMRMLNTTHPFATHRFKTGGREILISVGKETESKALLNMVTNQLSFEKLIEPYVKEAIDYEDLAKMWWPIGRDRSVVIDPKRHFGQPIVEQGVPTSILFQPYRAGRSIESIAAWYEVNEQAVKDAIDFEEDLLAA